MHFITFHHHISLCEISNHFVRFVYPQGSRDHPGPAVLWGHRHVVSGLCDSGALPGMAPLPRSLRVRSGNIRLQLVPPNRFLHGHLCSCVCSLLASVHSRVCLGGWDASLNPPDRPWWFLRSLHIYLNRCHRATCPISAAPVLQSKTSPRSPFSISQMRLRGKTLSKLCSITEQARLIFSQKVSHLQVSNQS